MLSIDATFQTDVAVSIKHRAPVSAERVVALNEQFEAAHPTTIIAWAAREFGEDLCIASSMADTLLIDLATRITPDIEVIFLDTGFHFPETLETLRRAQARYQLNLHVVRPAHDAADVWADGDVACCRDRKVGPLERALVGRKRAWMSGLRRSDSEQRTGADIVSLDRRGLLKINPLAHWSDINAEAYMTQYEVIVNPLTFQGYPSIGCWPCTSPVEEGADPRSGRWSSSDKSECGIHI